MDESGKEQLSRDWYTLENSLKFLLKKLAT
jgi:hypothetical protein